jgi:hypothetical protein
MIQASRVDARVLMFCVEGRLDNEAAGELGMVVTNVSGILHSGAQGIAFG